MKKCISCDCSKPLTSFGRNGLYRGKQKYKPTCNECYYKVQRVRMNLIMEDFYDGLSCSRCGYDECSEALECHHTDPSTKTKDICKMLTYSQKRIEEELEKCLLVCANCHREIHAEWRASGIA